MGRKKRNENITILFVPENSSKVTGFKLKAPIFITLAIVWFLSVISSAYIVTRHIDYRATIELSLIHISEPTRPY